MPPVDASKESKNVLFGGTNYPLLLCGMCSALNLFWWTEPAKGGE